MSADRVEFRRALVAAIGAVAFVATIGALLAPIGALAHLHGLVTAMCVTFPHVVSDVAALFLLGIVVSAVVAGTTTIAATILLERRIAREWMPTLDQVRRARVRAVTRTAGVAARVVVFQHADPIACTRGAIRRTIWISDACVDALTDQELRAVLAHEQHHCDRRDPLRLQLVTICARSLVAFPIVASTAQRFRCAAEHAADDHARRVAGARATARALLKFADARPAPLLAQFADATSISERVQRLLDAPAASTRGASSRALVQTCATTLAGIVCLALVVLLPGMG